MASRIFISALSILLTGCGLEPLYCGSPYEQQQFDIHIKGSGYSTYKFRRELEKSLAYTPKFDDNTYRLDINVSESQSGMVYRSDANITRNQEQLTARCTILLNKKQIGVITDTVVTSYPLTPSQEYVTKVAQDSASNRSSVALAESMARDILREIKTQNKLID